MTLTHEDLLAIRDIMRDEIKRELDPVKSDLKRLNETVAKIENVHGYKLGVLFDAQIDYNRSTATITGISETVDEHEHRLFALEQAAKVSNQ